MAMLKKTRRELRKLREVVRFLLIGRRCCFCGEPILEDESFDTAGDCTGPPLAERVCIHHLDGDHANCNPKNLAVSHGGCHKSYHAKVILHGRTPRLAGRNKS
jgi:hypothetical protein